MLAKEQGIRNVFVSNGFMSEESAGILGKVLDADNIDLKSFSDFFLPQGLQGQTAADPGHDWADEGAGGLAGSDDPDHTGAE